jgi:HSP20 family protein
MDREFSEAGNKFAGLFRILESGLAPQLMQEFPYYYRYQIIVGPDGKPHKKEFGNTESSSKGLIEQTTVRQPIIDT